MNKLFLFFFGILILLGSLSFANANFACGFVNNSQEYSSNWKTVMLYQEENYSNFINCKINPENKFCCDLEEISNTKLSVGDNVSAEIFDDINGLVAGPVSLIITGEGYDLFPNMTLHKAIIINYPIERILINQSSILANISLAEDYNNLRYTISSSNNFSEKQVCVNCNSSIFSIPLLNKGKNEITFIATGNRREIYEKIIVYNLDYFNFKINFACNKCYLKNKIFYVPSNNNISVQTYFNASHNISGEFLFYFPSEWSSFDSFNIQDFSTTHDILKENISERQEYIINYTLKTPTGLMKKEYTFYQQIENQEKISKVIVFKSKLIPFHKSKPFKKNYFYFFPMQTCSPNEPVILTSEKDYINFVAIFPRKYIGQSYSNLDFNIQKKLFKKQESFTISTSIQNKDIDYIILLFKVKEGKSIDVYNNKDRLNLEFFKKELNYDYYSAKVNKTGPFIVKIF